MTEWLRQKPLSELIERYPVAADFLENMRMDAIDRALPFEQALIALPSELLADFEISVPEMTAYLETLIEQAENREPVLSVETLGIAAGSDKDGRTESFDAEWSCDGNLLPDPAMPARPENRSLVTLKCGEIVCVVGPTGSGKSRLLEDVEYLAQGDSPTGRTILIDGKPVGDDMRFRQNQRLVAQLSQNMNFVMDLTVEEFLKMHAKCLDGGLAHKGSEAEAEGGAADRIRETFEQANALAGEPFTKETKVTQLSGGQSRALMIADTACMSEAPVVLVDEIENAGIDRSKALSLLAKKEKIVLMATHDPLLILMADRRIVVANGGIQQVLATSEEEKAALEEIAAIDERLQAIRRKLRGGGRIAPCGEM